MPPTIRDVARAAGVSSATVSYYLNNTKQLTAGTKSRIEAAMTDLQYRPNLVARALARRRSRIIALACPMAAEHAALTTQQVIVGAVRAAANLDYNLIVWPGDDGVELSRLAEQGLVEGVVVMGVQIEDARAKVLADMQVPFVLIGRTNTAVNVPFVDIDFASSMRVTFEHLQGLGHRNIVLVNGDQSRPGRSGFGPYVRSEAAYCDLAASSGMAPHVLTCGPDVTDGRLVAGQFLSQFPTASAAVVLDELAATGFVAELIQQGKSVPKDVSVVSVFSSREVAALSTPTMTTVVTPAAAMSGVGVEMLITHLHGERSESVLIACDLVTGGSTGPALTLAQLSNDC
ncbi:MAG: LacI family DNA-binding transcriptional regulator [Actinomycetota bacterium]